MGENISTLVVGIDEAGRGPLIGDLVIGITGIDEKKLRLLKLLGVRDSKKLDKYRRKLFYLRLIEILDIYSTVFISPYIIEKHNLNKLIINHIIECLILVRKYAIIRGYKQIKVYIDEVKGSYRYLPDLSSDELTVEIHMEEKSDEKYSIVAAASILAKHIRDRSLEPIKRIYGDFGSGYPSDYRTITWLKKIYDPSNPPPKVIRRNWSTLNKYARKWFYERK